MIAALAVAFLIIALTVGGDGDTWGPGFGIIAVISIGMSVFAAVLGTVASTVAMLNYRIAGTPDGVRITKGVFTQTNDTVAPGRIHSVSVNQSLLWRPFGWYQVTVNRADLQIQASESSENNQAVQQRQVLLPIGDRADVERVLALVLPMLGTERTLALIEAGMAPGRSAEFVSAPSRAWWLKPLAFRRLGYAIDRGVVYLRLGWLMRRLAIIPGERIQGVTISTGPWRRLAGVVTLSPDTVAGPVITRLPLVDAETAPATLLEF